MPAAKKSAPKPSAEKKRGRPGLEGDRVRLVLRIPPDLKKWLGKRAIDTDKQPSDVAVEAFELLRKRAGG